MKNLNIHNNHPFPFPGTNKSLSYKQDFPISKTEYLASDMLFTNFPQSLFSQVFW